MRLGSYPAILSKNSKVRDIYGSKKINERHGIDMKLICHLLMS